MNSKKPKPAELAAPHRVKLSRKLGWKMPPNTVKVARPSKWGNPFRIGADIDRDLAVKLFERHTARTLPLEELRGKNLACFCPLDQPCHADVLLRLANTLIRSAGPGGNE